jgi:hypothetical protein
MSGVYDCTLILSSPGWLHLQDDGGRLLFVAAQRSSAKKSSARKARKAPALTSHSTILHVVEENAHVISFGQKAERDEASTILGLQVTHDVYQDMGAPPQITLTIAPGDTLNG